MIPRAVEAEVLRLHHAERWPIGTIARQLLLHHSTVRRVLAQAGEPAAQKTTRPSIADPFIPFITETLKAYPKLCASRLHIMVRERGYRGGSDHFRSIVARLRPRPLAEAYLRLRTLPGEQCQCDWAHFGTITIGKAIRPLMAFVMVLSYSRHLFLRFYLNGAMNNFLRGHVEAFSAWGAVPRVVLYDNLRSAVLERRAEAIRFHPTLLELAAHYRFQPRPVAVARGNEKGRVERAIRFVRDRFFAARAFKDINDLNAQATSWCLQEAALRGCPEDRDRSVQAVFTEERPHLLALPDNPFPTEERLEGIARKTPYLRFDLNDYSIPHTHVGRPLQILASLERVRIMDAHHTLADHARSFDRGQQIEEPTHLQALVAHKRAGREHRALDRLHHAAPGSQKLFKLAAEHGVHLGVLTRGLLQILDTHGADALAQAIEAALAENAAHLSAVRHFIDQHLAARGAPPPIAVTLPQDPRVHLSVRAHDLREYEQLNQESTDDHPHTDPPAKP
ncbi:MAG: IS21 family transposase [Candidatus Acidiferrales bacterium]